MGNSTRRKKEKRLDFQKPKLKVGKAKPKPTNHTDTSFRSKAIVLNQQSLSVSAPTAVQQFQRHVSMLSSRSDSQRKESLAYLTSFAESMAPDTSLPMPLGNLMEKVCPLIVDIDNGVRNQVLKLFQSLRRQPWENHVRRMLPFMRAGITHLSRDIKVSGADTFSWFLDAVGVAMITCPGGWVQTMDHFLAVLKWTPASNSSQWTRVKTPYDGDAKLTTKLMQVFAKFLQIGFKQEQDVEFDENALACDFPSWHCTAHAIPARPTAYAYLNLFGELDGNSSVMEYREDRITVFDEYYREVVLAGIQAARLQGGEPGRVAGQLMRVLEHAVIRE